MGIQKLIHFHNAPLHVCTLLVDESFDYLNQYLIKTFQDVSTSLKAIKT